MTLSEREREREREKVTEKEKEKDREGEREYKLKGIINVPTIDSEQSKSFSDHLFHFD